MELVYFAMLKMTFIKDEDELLQSNSKIPLHKGEPETQTNVSVVISSDHKTRGL